MIFVLITLLGVTFVGARYARLDRLVFDTTYTVDRALRRLRRHLRRRRGHLPRRQRRPGRRAEADRRGRRRRPRHRQGLRRRSRARRSPWSATGRPSASSTSSSSRRPTTSPTSRTARRSRSDDTEIPIATTELLTDLDNLSSRSTQDDLRTVVDRARARRSTAPARDLGQIIDTGTRSSRPPTPTSTSPRR